jgi:hypothetical protein
MNRLIAVLLATLLLACPASTPAKRAEAGLSAMSAIAVPPSSTPTVSGRYVLISDLHFGRPLRRQPLGSDRGLPLARGVAGLPELYLDVGKRQSGYRHTGLPYFATPICIEIKIVQLWAGGVDGALPLLLVFLNRTWKASSDVWAQEWEG